MVTGWGARRVWWWILLRWQARHSRVQPMISLDNLRHTNLDEIKRRQASLLGWATLWKCAKISFLNFRGTIGRKMPLETSPDRRWAPVWRKANLRDVPPSKRRTDVWDVHVCKHILHTICGTIHHSFKSLCSVGQPKWREQVHKQAKCHNYCRFWDGLGHNRDLVITLDKIEFWKNGATMQAVGNVLHVWQRILVRGCHQIETAVIPTRPPQSVFFGNDGQRWGPWWFWRTNNASSFLPFELSFGNV